MELNKILTIGVTSHNSNIAPSLLEYLKTFKNIQVLISEDGNETPYEGFNTIFCKTTKGPTENRQNILNHIETKYVYFIDADDQLYINEDKLLSELDKSSLDVIFVDAGTKFFPTDIYIAPWAQILKTEFIKGKLVPSWRGFEEELPTHIEILKTYPNFQVGYTQNVVYNYNGIHDGTINFDRKAFKDYLIQAKENEDEAFNSKLKKLLIFHFNLIPFFLGDTRTKMKQDLENIFKEINY